MLSEIGIFLRLSPIFRSHDNLNNFIKTMLSREAIQLGSKEVIEINFFVPDYGFVHTFCYSVGVADVLQVITPYFLQEILTQEHY